MITTMLFGLLILMSRFLEVDFAGPFVSGPLMNGRCSGASSGLEPGLCSSKEFGRGSSSRSQVAGASIVSPESGWLRDHQCEKPSRSGVRVLLSDHVRPGVPGQSVEMKRALAEASGGTLVIPKGVWYLEAEVDGALVPEAHTTIELQEGAILQQEPTGLHSSTMIVLDAEDVHVRGEGTIRGDLRSHKVTTGDNTFLIWVRAGATGWTVVGPTLTESWGDGLYVGGVMGSGPVIGGCVDEIVADNNRRQGLSVTWSEDLVIGSGNKFINTGRLAKDLGLERQFPTAGVDVEPNPWSWVHRMVVGGSTARNNVGAGWLVQGPWQARSSDVTFLGTRAVANGDPDEKGDTGRVGDGFSVKEGGFARLVDISARSNAGSGVAVRGALSSERSLQGRVYAVGGVSVENVEYGWYFANQDQYVEEPSILVNVQASENRSGSLFSLSGDAYIAINPTDE